MQRHYKGKKLLPKIFKKENHIDEIKGVYVPFWLFDADADADIRYKATRVRTWSDSDYDYTETSYYSIGRSGDIGFDRVPVDGSSKMPDDLMESIEPFKFEDAVDFKTAYLAGYLADKYDVTAEQSIDRANERIKRSTEDAFASTVEGVSLRYDGEFLHSSAQRQGKVCALPRVAFEHDVEGQKVPLCDEWADRQICRRPAGG